MEAHVLGLESETLEEFRSSLNMAIRSLVNNLVERGLQEGTVNARIKISMSEEPGRYGDTEKIMKIEPDVGIKVSASAKIKCGEHSGIRLAYNDDGQPIIGDNQISIDEYIRTLKEEGA